VFDPWASPERVKHEYGIDVVNTLPNDKYSAAIIAVAHRQFREMEIDFEKLLEPNHVIYDVKAIMPRNLVDGRL
jgi:UDP-N-acetyl-D-galactosamine dehydrogenase